MKFLLKIFHELANDRTRSRIEQKQEDLNFLYITCDTFYKYG